MVDSTPLRDDFAPWSFAELASPEARLDQSAHHEELRARGYEIGDGCFVSRLAAVHPETLVLGDGSTVAAHAHLTGDLRIGADCTINVATAVRGTVRMGDGVRIGSHTSILAFNHAFADLTVPIRLQGITSAGITIGDDVWLGNNVVVLDGVSIGSHAVIGAGAVVTRDVPEWAIVVGNPARVVRDRRGPRGQDGAGAPIGAPTLADRLRALGERAREQAPELLARSFDDAAGAWVDRPGSAPTVRAHCDAVELGDLLLGGPPAPWPRTQHVDALRALQRHDSGLVPEVGAPGPGAGAEDSGPLGALSEDIVAYHVLAVGYALDLLGSEWAVPLSFVGDLTPDAVVATLDGLDLRADSWRAGHLVDALGTGLTWELRAGRPVPAGAVEALLGWLLVNRDPATGLWGRPGHDGLRLPVNGFYRTVRGTFAQWGVGLPDHRTLIDALLRHATDARVFAPGRATACDVLDLVHPLWWLTQHDRGYRWQEITDVVSEHASRIAARWSPTGGFAFGEGAASGRDDPQDVTLQGTEMWLATLWFAADLLDLSGELRYRPRGVHRPEPLIAAGRAGATGR